MNSPARTHTTGEEELARGNIPKLFVKFVIPGMLALFMLSAQLFMDGLLIGNFIGANAMGSVNLVIPIYDALIACAVVICVGCQCIIGMKLGEDDLQTANDTLRTGLIFALVAIGIAGALVYLFAPGLVRLMGANDVLQNDAVTFIRVLAPFFPFPVVMYLFDAVLKSVGRPIYATLGMSAMVLSNVALDLLFILTFEWGIAGVAFATGLSYLIGLSVYMPALLHKDTPVNLLTGRFRMKLAGKLLYIGSAEGVTELSACVVTLMFNIVLMHYAGEKGIAAFTAINYLNFVLMSCIIGMSEGLRSIISYNYGMEAFSRIRATLRLAIRVTAGFAIIMFSGFFFFGNEMISLFFSPKETDIITLAASGTAILAFSYLFNGFNILTAGVFTSIGQARYSLLISLLRGCILLFVFLMFLPSFMGIRGIWLTVPLAEVFTFLIGGVLYMKKIRHIGEQVPAQGFHHEKENRDHSAIYPFSNNETLPERTFFRKEKHFSPPGLKPSFSKNVKIW